MNTTSYHLAWDVFFEDIPEVNWYETDLRQVSLPCSADIWQFSISQYKDEVRHLYSFLSAEEKIRSLKFHKEGDRQRHIISKAMLRVLLGKYLSADPAALQFYSGQNHKPCLNGNPVHFNLSHSGDYVLIAIADDEVGIDVEKIEEYRAMESLLPEIFNDDEISLILSSTESLQVFYKLWTRKEALLKASSIGLNAELNHVPSLSCSCHASTMNTPKGWSVSSFNLDAKHTASIAYSGKVEKLSFRRLKPASRTQKHASHVSK